MEVVVPVLLAVGTGEGDNHQGLQYFLLLLLGVLLTGLADHFLSLAGPLLHVKEVLCTQLPLFVCVSHFEAVSRFQLERLHHLRVT